MKNSRVVKVILLVCGVIAAGIGAAILLMPAVFYAANGIDLGANVSLLNEIRASGGLLLAAGILIVSGSFIASLTFSALVVACLLYLSYGLSRIVGFAIDGMPSEGLVQAAALEIVLAVVCVTVFAKYRRSKTESE